MNKLTYWRMKRGFTVQELADKSKVSTGTISRLENQHRKAYASTIGKLALALEIDPIELLELVEGDNQREEKPKQYAA